MNNPQFASPRIAHHTSFPSRIIRMLPAISWKLPEMKLSAGQERVYDELRKAASGLTYAELCAHTKLAIKDVTHTIEDLVHRGLVSVAYDPRTRVQVFHAA